MCGIAGIWSTRLVARELAESVGRMSAALAHRGPDDSGVWVDAAAGVALGHRRLAIVDLSAAGRQPMRMPGGRYSVVFNGEIYNHQELRAELALEGWAFQGLSDTEVLLAGIEAWGVDRALQRFEGMLALALWDHRERCLTLARDRLGKKPLYVGLARGTLVFASELGAFQATSVLPLAVNPDALRRFFQRNHVPTPLTIYHEVMKLPAATVLTLRLDDLDAAGPLELLGRNGRRYWDFTAIAQTGAADPLELSDDEAVDAVAVRLGEAVASRRIADVPLGAFLSGGVDSSIITALMQAQSPAPVRTFCIGFDDGVFDEAAHAEAVARHLGTDHTTLVVTPRDALDVIPQLPEAYSEPFADSSQIPTLLLARMARSSVTVALTGDGGDEAFAGYNRHVLQHRLRRLQRLPGRLRQALGRALQRLPPPLIDRTLRQLRRSGIVAAPGLSAYRLHKLAALLTLADLAEPYAALVAHWGDETLVRDGDRDEGRTRATAEIGLAAAPPPPAFTDPALAMLWADTTGYLHDDILVKLDRATMAHGLEARCPFLDHRVIELAWRLPLRQRMRDGEGKWVLRRLLERHVPKALIERPKVGFAVPLGEWLRGPLRDWAEALLSEAALARDGLLHAEPIRAAWAAHLAGGQDRSDRLWCALMFQAWSAAQRGRPHAAADEAAADLGGRWIDGTSVA